VPYALNSKISDGVADNSITSAKISNGAITANDLGNNSVTSAKITDGTIAAADLAASSVTTDKINNGAVTSSKLSATGGSSGQVLKLSGTAFAWGNDNVGGLSLPYSGSSSTAGNTDLLYLKNLGTGRGMQVEAGTNTAIWGRSAGGYAGIDGRNTTGYGVYGNSESGDGIHGRSTSGNGVYGQSTKYGVYGKSTGTQGRSVTGEAEGTASIAVQGIATNTSSTGVWGEGSNQGVYGKTALATGKGVYGVASSATGENYGVYGESASSGGLGVYGKGSAGVVGRGQQNGVSGYATASSNAFGVIGRTTSETGTTTIAVLGDCSSPTGYSGFFVGGQFHISGNTGIGTSAPAYKLDVIGSIRATGSVYYGGSEGLTNGTLYNKPDYVFGENYRALRTEDVEEYLERENHLPWITSAEKEKEENGDVTDMSRMAFETVETVENLQLQIIDQQKMIRELKAENKKMKNRLERIERLLNYLFQNAK